jgi:hypothetical protein
VTARVRTDVVRSLHHQCRDLHQSTYPVPLRRSGLILLSPSTGLITNGPAGHRSKTCNRHCGFGRVYTLTHDPVKGTMLPPPSPNSPRHDFVLGPDQGFQSGFTVPMGRLPKMNFPRFHGENLSCGSPTLRIILKCML